MSEEQIVKRGLLAFVVALTVSIMGCAGIGWLINLDTQGSYVSSKDFTRAAEIAVPRFTDSVGRITRVRQDIDINAIYFRVPVTNSLLEELKSLPASGNLYAVKIDKKGESYSGFAKVESGTVRFGFVPAGETNHLDSLRLQMKAPEP